MPGLKPFTRMKNADSPAYREFRERYRAAGTGSGGGGSAFDDEDEPLLRRELLSGWQSGSANPKAIALKYAAKEAFGLPGIVYEPLGRDSPGQDLTVERAVRAVRLMYQETQEALRELLRGVTPEVTLYRGVEEDYRRRGVIEAWTSSEDVAEDYAGPDGVVLIRTVPTSRILAWYNGSDWPTGPAHYEWIVLSEEPRRR